MRPRRLFLIALIACLLMPGLCRAADFTLWPALEADEVYDNNVFLTPTGRKGDFVSAESPGFTLESDSPARNFYLSYQTLLLEHAHYSAKDRFGGDHYAALRDFERLTNDTSLSLSDSLLIGNALGGALATNGSTPIGSQLMQSLLYSTTATSNDFAADLTSKYSDAFTWTANIHQLLFIANSSGVSKYSFDQGAALNGDYRLGEDVTAGLGYRFDDFRFSNNSLPVSESHWPQLTLGWTPSARFSFKAAAGPSITETSSGELTTTHVPAQTVIRPAFLVTGAFNGQRFTAQLSASQAPELSAGLVGAVTGQSYGALFQYKLTRRFIVFANAGYLDLSGTGIYARLITYTGGADYRLTRSITINAQYFGFRSLATGSTVGTIVAVPGRESITDLFELGMTFTPAPLKWRWQ